MEALISMLVLAEAESTNGGDTWFNATSLANAVSNGSSVSVAAQGGISWGAGGSAASSVGTNKYSGGDGGTTDSYYAAGAVVVVLRVLMEMVGRVVIATVETAMEEAEVAVLMEGHLGHILVGLSGGMEVIIIWVLAEDMVGFMVEVEVVEMEPMVVVAVVGVMLIVVVMEVNILHGLKLVTLLLLVLVEEAEGQEMVSLGQSEAMEVDMVVVVEVRLMLTLELKWLVPVPKA